MLDGRGVGCGVLVISPIGALIAAALGSAAGPTPVRTAVVSSDGEVRRQRRASAATDVVLVDAGAAGNAAFDVLVAAEILVPIVQAPVVVRRSPSHSDPATEELAERFALAGTVDERLPVRALTSALHAAARGLASTHLTRPSSGAHQTLHGLLRRSRLAMAVACTVVVDGARSWQEIARLSGFSVRTVQAAPRQFAPLVARAGAVAPDELSQAALFHWLGRHESYIRSFANRNGWKAVQQLALTS